MRMKPREDAKHERRNGIQTQSFAIDAALCTADFHRVRLLKPTAPDRSREIYRVVAVSFSADRCGNRMGNVSVFTLKDRRYYLEVLVSLPQHSGRTGNSELFQPPPRAWTSVTASAMRRPRILTAVISSERAAL